MAKYECKVFTKSVEAYGGKDGATMNALNSFLQEQPNAVVLHVNVDTMVFRDDGKVASYDVSVFYKQRIDE